MTSRSKAQTLKADFTAYFDGFSPNVQVILDKFKFRNQIDTMVDADILGAVIEKFTSSDINLSPNPVDCLVAESSGIGWGYGDEMKSLSEQIVWTNEEE